MQKNVFLNRLFKDCEATRAYFVRRTKVFLSAGVSIILSLVSSFSFSQVSLFPEKSESFLFIKSEDSGSPVQERQVAYTISNEGLKVSTSIKALTREYYPMNIDFSYDLIKKDGGYYVDFTSVINPMHLTSSMWETFRNDYQGDKVFYPEALQVGASLPDCLGKIKVLLPDNSYGFEEYSLTDRIVSKIENIVVGGQTLSGYVLTSTYQFRSKIFNEAGTESLTQWIVPGKGVVKELRSIQGKQITTEIR